MIRAHLSSRDSSPLPPPASLPSRPSLLSLSLAQLLRSLLSRLVFFGAATEDQDQGMNPSHVNEASYAYWATKFARAGYALDLAASAMLRRVT